MFGRKKYRKGKEYLVMVSGVIFLPYSNKNFFSSTTVLIKESMDAVEMRDWAFDYARQQHKFEDGTFCYNFYHVESL